VPAPLLQKVSTLTPRTKFPTPTIVEPAPSRVNSERTYPRILSSILPITHFKEVYRMGTGLKSAGSLRTGIPFKATDMDGCGRRRRAMTGFCTASFSQALGGRDDVEMVYVVRSGISWDRGIQQVCNVRLLRGVRIIRIGSVQHPIRPGWYSEGAFVTGSAPFKCNRISHLPVFVNFANLILVRALRDKDIGESPAGRSPDRARKANLELPEFTFSQPHKRSPFLPLHPQLVVLF
jgi:hypothetical protein